MMGLDFLLLAIDIMYLRKEKKKWYDIILYIGFILLLEKTANSRTAEVIILMLIIIHLLSIMVNDAYRALSIVKILVLVFMDFQFMTMIVWICSFHTFHFTGELLPQSSSPLQLYMRL